MYTRRYLYSTVGRLKIIKFSEINNKLMTILSKLHLFTAVI